MAKLQPAHACGLVCRVHTRRAATARLLGRLCCLAVPGPAWLQGAAEAVVVFVLAYATAFGETLTIAHFPYYSFKVRLRPPGSSLLPYSVTNCYC